MSDQSGRVSSCIHTNCGRAADTEVAGRACCMACAMAWGTRTAPVHIRRCDLREAGRRLCSCGHGEERHDDLWSDCATCGSPNATCWAKINTDGQNCCARCDHSDTAMAGAPS